MKTFIFGVIVSGVAAATANGMIIDTFETGQTVVADMNTTTDMNSVSGPGILGGERDLSAFWTNGPNDVEHVANASNDGLLSFSLGADTSGTGDAVWDGTDASRGLAVNYTGLGGVDLTGGGTDDRLGVKLVFNDLPSTTLSFWIYTDQSNWSHASIILPAGIGITLPMLEIDILYSNFVVGGGTGADFSNVGAIVMEIAPEFPSADTQIDFIETDTPAPGTLALTGLAGLVGFRRRRR